MPCCPWQGGGCDGQVACFRPGCRMCRETQSCLAGCRPGRGVLLVSAGALRRGAIGLGGLVHDSGGLLVHLRNEGVTFAERGASSVGGPRGSGSSAAKATGVSRPGSRDRPVRVAKRRVQRLLLPLPRPGFAGVCRRDSRDVFLIRPGSTSAWSWTRDGKSPRDVGAEGEGCEGGSGTEGLPPSQRVKGRSGACRIQNLGADLVKRHGTGPHAQALQCARQVVAHRTGRCSLAPGSARRCPAEGWRSLRFRRRA